VTSRNFITPSTTTQTHTDSITIHDNATHERGTSIEPKTDARDTAKDTRPSITTGPPSNTTQKRKAGEQHIDGTTERPYKTRGKRIDYKQLADPHKPEEEPDLISQYTNATEIKEDIHTLANAKASPEWPEWEKAIKAKLDQLKCTGTWQMVKKLPGAVMIVNRWVFAKKRDRSGKVVKYKARLVAKGCTQ
jgi:hypothetical protein